MRRWILNVGVLAISVALLAGVGMIDGVATAATPSSLPVVYNGALGYAQASPTASPPGANDWSCRPSAAHPRPVVLVHGTFGDMADSWQALSPLLADNGYCVFALNYGAAGGSGAFGVYGVGDIAPSAQELAAFVDRVMAATGASQVDIVGHSQGGMMPRYYIKDLGGAPSVHTLVGLAPSNHGTTLGGLATLGANLPQAEQFTGAVCAACAEQEAGSPFLTALNAGGDTVAGVNYTVIESRVRRGRHALYVGVPLRWGRDEYHPAGSVPAGLRGASVDALRPHRRHRRAQRPRPGSPPDTGVLPGGPRHAAGDALGLIYHTGLYHPRCRVAGARNRHGPRGWFGCRRMM